MQRQEREKLKIVVSGNSGVGKRALIAAYLGLDEHNYNKKIEDTYPCIMNINNNVVETHIWTTFGQEDIANTREHKFPGADVIIWCYDCTQMASLQDLRTFWLVEIEKVIDVEVPYILVGNKLDLQDESPDDYIEEQQAVNLQKRIGASYQFQCRALDCIRTRNRSETIEEIFNCAGRCALQQREKPKTTVVKCTIL